MADVAAVDPLPFLARGIELTATMTALGTLAVAVLILPPAKAPVSSEPGGMLERLFRTAAATALLSCALWLPVQAQRIAEGGQDWFATTWLVATQTTFGSALAARFGLLALAAGFAGRFRSRPRLLAATSLTAAALSLQPWLGHAAAAADWLLPTLVGLHVLAAGLWIGSLPALLVAMARLPDRAAAIAARRFSWLGLAAVATILATALPQSLPLVGDVGGLFGTPYGLVALAKTAGLAGLLALAALNRFVLTPRLVRGGSRGALVASIAVETGLGAAVVAAASALASLPPGAHEQAVWPFPLQPDLSRVGEAYFAKELWRAAAVAGFAAAGLAALLWRRTRLIGPVAAALALFWLPFPNLALLAKPAWPTSFQRSETGFTAASILRGEELLRRHCTPDCFRPRDDPSDPTPYGLWQRGDGDLYGWLTETFDKIGHSPFPHGTIAGFAPRERWQLIDYFRARVAGSTARRSGGWLYPVLTPDFELRCRDGRSAMRELLGQAGPIEITAALRRAPIAPEAAPEGIALTRILLSAGEQDAIPAGFDCMSSSPDAAAAFALISGLDEERLDGTRLLVDANGWLRSRILPPHPEAPGVAAPGWQEELARIAAAPFEAGGIGTHRH